MALSNLLVSSTIGVLVLVLASNTAIASAAPSPNTITDILLPSPNITGGPAAEIQCYALPYGAVGIISHLLTYWTIAWMALGRAPLFPVLKLDSYKFDLFLAIAALCTCIPIASITIHRCRLSWHFVLISIWKLVTSVSLACVSIHRCILVRQHPPEKHRGRHAPVPDLEQDTSYRMHVSQPELSHTHRKCASFWRGGQTKSQEPVNFAPLWWLILYLAGTIVGMVGLCSLLWTSFRQNRTVRDLTYAFAAPVVLIPLLVAIFWYSHYAGRPGGGRRVLKDAYQHTLYGAFLAFIAVFGFFSALYGDLVLGAIAENLLGLPSADFAPLYWVWFIAKRLPLLSF